MPRFFSHFRQALSLWLKHDVLNTAKAVAYSGMLMFFPALMVLAALVAKVPEGPTLLGEFRATCEQFLPADTMSLMQVSMQTGRIRSSQLIYSATSLSVFAGLGMMLS